MNVLAAISLILAAPLIWVFIVNSTKKKWISIVCFVLTFSIIGGFCFYVESARNNFVEGANVACTFDNEKVYEDDGEYFIVVTNKYNPLNLYERQLIDKEFVDEWASFADKYVETIEVIRSNED
jgi:hypothetical protein